MKGKVLVGIVGVAMCLLFFWSFTGQQKTGPLPVRRPSVLRGLQVVEFSQRGILWNASVRKATSGGSGTPILRAEDIRIYWPERALTVHAPRGNLDTKRMKISLQGRVRAFRGDFQVEAPVIERDPESREIHARGGIKVRGKGYTIKADEATLKNNGVFEARGNVHAVFGD